MKDIAIVGFVPPERPAFPSHVQYTGENRLLSPPEVEKIVEWCDAQPLQKGTIGNGGSKEEVQERPDYRCVETCAVEIDPFKWLYARIAQKAQWANNDFFRFNLTGLCEPISYLKYTAASEEQPEPGHYDWHQDFGGGPFAMRKLSMVIQLSNPADYDGCALHLCNDGPWEVPYRQPGDAILFPSWTPHCVSNIERGVRRALVVWISGPQFQ